MITLRKIHSRRCTMKVSQGIHCWLEYHKLHSKKHHQNLPVHPFQTDRPIWWTGPQLTNPRRNSLLPHPNQSGHQTGDQKNSVLPIDLFLQFHYSKPWPRFQKPMRYPYAEKVLSIPWTHPLDYSRKGSRGWGHLSYDQTQKPVDAWVDGAGWDEDQRGLAINTKWYWRPEANPEESQEWKGARDCFYPAEGRRPPQGIYECQKNWVWPADLPDILHSSEESCKQSREGSRYPFAAPWSSETRSNLRFSVRSPNWDCQQGHSETCKPFNHATLSWYGERYRSNEVDWQSLQLKRWKRGEEFKTAPLFQAKSNNIIFKPQLFGSWKTQGP